MDTYQALLFRQWFISKVVNRKDCQAEQVKHEYKYLYNGKFTEKASDSTMIGGIGNKSVAMKALNKINEQITSVLTVRLPEEKSVAVAADKK